MLPCMLAVAVMLELTHANLRAATPGGAFALSQVALRCTRTVRMLRQLESPYTATEALTPHDHACKKYFWPSMVGPAVQLFHVVSSGFGAPEKLRDRTLHDASSYAVTATDTPGCGMGAGGAEEQTNVTELVPLTDEPDKQTPDGAEPLALGRAVTQPASLKS